MAIATHEHVESIRKPNYHEFHIPHNRVELEENCVLEGAVGANVPVERLLALDGLCVEVALLRSGSPGDRDIIVDAREVAEAFRDEHRPEEAAWWEGFRQRAVTSCRTSDAAVGWLFFPNTWLSELGADATDTN